MPLSREDVVAGEISGLRAEMRELKNCQLRYFTLAALAAGAILGTNSIFGERNSRELAALAPLVVILPCWLTFFDKATTITRIASYVRLLEEILKSPQTSSSLRYEGFETALRMFREHEDNEGASGKLRLSDFRHWRAHFKLLALRTRHRYWALNWWTFFLLSALCSVLPFALGLALNPFVDRRAWVAYASLALVLTSVLFTLYILINLHSGRYSYNENEAVWRRVLRP